MATAKPAVVGAFVLGSLALLVAGIMFWGGTSLFAQAPQAVIFFDGSVAGLDIGAPVTFRGVRVGSVKRVELQLLPSGRATIPVVVEFSPELVTYDGRKMEKGLETVEQFVAAGLRAQLNLQSFVTGQLRIDLDFMPGTPVPPQPASMDHLPRIPALPSDLERLRASLAELPIRELSQNMLRVLESVDRLANHLDTQIVPLLTRGQQGVDTAIETMEAAQAAIRQLQGDASRTLAEANDLLADTRHQVDNRGADLARVLQSADRVAHQADTLLAALNGMADRRAEFRGNLEASIRDLAATAASLRSLASTLERDPGVLLRGRGK